MARNGGRATLNRLYPIPSVHCDLNAVYADLKWIAPKGRPFVAVNMVASADGRATLEGTARGIGSEIDRVIMIALRAQADAILWGAGTLRAEPVGRGVPEAMEPARILRGLTAQPLLVVLSASGDVPLERGVFAEPERAIVFVANQTLREAVERLRQRAIVQTVGEETPDPAAALDWLARERGVRHVVCEGGPTLNHALIRAGLVDELFLTLAPKLIAGDGRPITNGPVLNPPQSLKLLSVYERRGDLFLRYAIV